jgi:hypothetical protein
MSVSCAALDYELPYYQFCWRFAVKPGLTGLWR